MLAASLRALVLLAAGLAAAPGVMASRGGVAASFRSSFGLRRLDMRRYVVRALNSAQSSGSAESGTALKNWLSARPNDRVAGPRRSP